MYSLTFLYIYMYDESMKRYKEFIPPIPLFVLSTWYQSLGLRFEEFLRRMPRFSSRIGRQWGEFFETSTSRARGISPSAQRGAPATNECRHQVRWPKSVCEPHAPSWYFALFPTRRHVRAHGASSDNTSSTTHLVSLFDTWIYYFWCFLCLNALCS